MHPGHLQNKRIDFEDWGELAFADAWQRQETLLRQTVALKSANRKLPEAERLPTPNRLVFCSHPHVYTLGKSGKEAHLLLGRPGLEELGIRYHKTNRGGDITYHGPGQVVGYPILDLDNFFTDVHRYLRLLEETVIRTLADYGLQGGRIEDATGVWLDADSPEKARKICAMGIRCSRWVTMHGWALNVNVDTAYFDNIIPCGIGDKGVASMHNELGVGEVPVTGVKRSLLRHFLDVFGGEFKGHL